MSATITETQVSEWLSTISQVLSDQTNVDAISQAVTQNWTQINDLYQEFANIASTLNLSSTS